jgi:hypothetical protein
MISKAQNLCTKIQMKTTYIEVFEIRNFSRRKHFFCVGHLFEKSLFFKCHKNALHSWHFWHHFWTHFHFCSRYNLDIWHNYSEYQNTYIGTTKSLNYSLSFLENQQNMLCLIFFYLTQITNQWDFRISKVESRD